MYIAMNRFRVAKGSEEAFENDYVPDSTEVNVKFFCPKWSKAGR